MTRAPTPAAIYAAELRVAQAKRNTRESLQKANTAFRAALVRPTTLLGVLAASGVVGFFLARRPKKVQVSSAPSETASVAATTSLAGVILAFIVRYVMQRLPFILQRVWALRRQDRAASAAAKHDPDMAQSSSTGYPAASTGTEY
jgi:hypothetical protein